MRVKICGITTPADACLAAESGADLIGLNFYPPSPRFVGTAQARQIVAALPAAVRAVGVLVGPSPEELQQCGELPGLRCVQFHAAEAQMLAPAVRRLQLDVILAQGVRHREDLAELRDALAAWQAATSQDANSAQADPLWAGDLSAGDFSLQAGSPAFTGGRNAGARKWRTQPNWAALTAQWDAGFYAHPTDAIGGSRLVTRS